MLKLSIGKVGVCMCEALGGKTDFVVHSIAMPAHTGFYADREIF